MSRRDTCTSHYLYARQSIQSLMAAAVLCPLAASQSASADTILWMNPNGGVFGVASNWLPQRVPIAKYDAVLSVPGLTEPFTITLNQAASARKLEVQRGSPTIDLSSRTYSIGEQLRVNGAGGARLRLVNGTVQCAGSMLVGWDQSGELELENVIVNTSTWPGVGGGNGPSVGVMRLFGPSTRVNKTACCDSSIGQGVGITGQLLVCDQAQVNRDQGFLSAGRHGGMGELSIASGGSLSHSSGRAVVGNGVGASTASIGNVTVTGLGSRWQLADFHFVGYSGGTGNLTVAGGGQVVVVNADVGSVGVCGGDVDGNRTINSADLTGDGVTDAVDLANLLAAWGPCDE